MKLKEKEKQQQHTDQQEGDTYDNPKRIIGRVLALSRRDFSRTTIRAYIFLFLCQDVLFSHFLIKKTRQRPTLPLRHQSSTIGTKGLNFRVRNGNGCIPFVMVAGIKF